LSVVSSDFDDARLVLALACNTRRANHGTKLVIYSQSVALLGRENAAPHAFLKRWTMASCGFKARGCLFQDNLLGVSLPRQVTVHRL